MRTCSLLSAQQVVVNAPRRVSSSHSRAAAGSCIGSNTFFMKTNKSERKSNTVAHARRTQTAAAAAAEIDAFHCSVRYYYSVGLNSQTMHKFSRLPIQQTEEEDRAIVCGKREGDACEANSWRVER